MDTSHNFALSLSGGGLSALAYAGFVEVLKEHGLKPSSYAGLSGGAILAVLLASNLSSEKIIKFYEQLKTFRILNTHLSRLEIVDHKKLELLIRDLLPYKLFEKLPMPVFIFVTDLTKKEPLILKNGDIASALVASCSVFPMLQPLKRKGLLLGDGGFTVYYGAQYLHDLGIKKVIGIDVTGITEGSVGGIFRALYKQINSAVTSNARYELTEHPVDLDIKITFPSPSIFSFERKTQHLLQLGRKSAQQHLANINAVLRKS